ncbi:unnamed protein product [Effrenium voratum]|nr:unnamed protein product [Effrenium voratum]
MSLFAASLDTLKKRTTQLLDGLDKGKEGGSRSPDIQEPSVEIPYDAQVSQALGCPDDSILVRYEVQNAEDKDTELTLYSMPLSGAVSITLAMATTLGPALLNRAGLFAAGQREFGGSPERGTRFRFGAP